MTQVERAEPTEAARSLVIGALLLDGRSATAQEHERAARMVKLLSELIGRLGDDGASARALHDAARLLLRPLGRPEEALVAARAAFQTQPQALALVRSYREVAAAAGARADLLLALEAETRLWPPGPERAGLLVERGRLIRDEHLTAARALYEEAILGGLDDLEALDGLERIWLADGNLVAAADCARRQAASATDLPLRAEHTARAARYLEKAGDLEGAWTLAAQAQLHQADSPAVRFLVERLTWNAGRLANLVAVREAQIEDGSLDAAAGWYDVGIIARYRSHDRALAITAFTRSVAQSTEAGSREAALQELIPLLASAGEWTQVVARERQRLACQDEPERAADRALSYLRIGHLFEEKLEDDSAALTAFEGALAEDPACADARAAAGRIYQKRGAGDRLLRMHELEAQYARAPLDRALALRRTGALLVEDPARLQEGIAALRASLDVLPDDLTAWAALERALEKLNAWSDLCALYEAALERQPPAARRYWLLTQLGTVAADRLGDLPRARAAFRQACDLGEVGPHLALHRLASLLQVEKLPGAAELAGVLTRLAAAENDLTQKASLLEQAAAVHERHGAMEEALELYRQGIAVAPPSHPIQAAAGRAFIRAGRYDDLLALLDLASAGVPDSERALWLMRSADVLARRLGRTEEAIGRLRQVLELWPGHGPAHQLLEALLDAEERWAELGELLRSTASSGDRPESISQLLRRATLAEARGDDGAALELYAEALEAGSAVALVPWTRLAAARQHWERLARHYADPTPGAFSPVHARYRAAELFAEQLDLTREASRLLEAMLVDEPGQLTALVPLARLLEEPGQVARVSQEILAASSDAATRAQALGRAARALEELGQTAEAIGLREQLLAERPRDLQNQELLRAALERQGDRTRLAVFLQVLATDTRSDPSVRSALLVDLARVQEELGQWREAADALEGSLELEGELVSLLARLALPGLHGTLNDETRHRHSLAQLAEKLPAGPERACCLRRLAQRLLRAGQPDAAASALESALAAYPSDGETLVALGALLDKLGRSAELVDTLMRAFAQETDQNRLGRLGVVLAGRLIQEGRLGPARATVERVLALQPDSLNGLLLLAELDDRERSWTSAARRLRAIAAHPQGTPAIRLRALSELATLQVLRLEDPEGARQTLAQITSSDDDPEALLARLDVEQAIQDHRAQAATLESLAGLAGTATPEEGWFLLKLAQLHEKLDEQVAAVGTLDRITTPELLGEVIDSLVSLAERSQRWELVAPSLERLLDSSAGEAGAVVAALGAAREAPVRLQLARLAEAVPERRAAAARHYARVVGLGQSTPELLEKLAELEAEADPGRAVVHHRALLAAQPDRLASYRTLGRLFAALGDEDATFCAEAVLVGLGEADEEETYFYRQRRQRLSDQAGEVLTDEELALLCPELRSPLGALLASLAPVLGTVFPLDASVHGPEGAPAVPGSPVRQSFDQVADVLGVKYRLRFTLPRLGPTVEPGEPPLVLVPRALEDSTRRDQLFVAGLLLGRIACHGVLADPRRTDPMAPRVLEQLVLAACELGDRTYVSPSRGRPLFEDLKRRLEAQLPADSMQELAQAVARLRSAGTGRADAGESPIDAAAALAAMNRAAVRLGLLLCGDPATGIAWLRRMEPALPGQNPTWLAALATVVAPEQLAIRRRLGVGVR